ncbi:hypothetical protein [Marinomonas sp.]|uniref:hypothetical protein n=1 Tax=Marinomonas sp. TaxID=1904862 RepID=UPI003A958F55
MHDIKLPKFVLNFLVEVLTRLGEGDIVQMTPMHAELIAQQAADILNMSRPTSIKLLDDGATPFNPIGNHRTVAYVDVMKYKETLLN